MKKALLILLACWLASGGLVLAQEAPVVDATMSGSWFDPAHDGEGFVLQVLGDDQAVVYWFTYDEFGQQRWFIATGTVDGDRAVFDALLQTRGPEFGERFDPDHVELFDVGELTLTWSDCTTARADYTVDGTAGTQSLTRLSTLAGLDCDNPGGNPSVLSGSWFDQTHDGEGLTIQALADGRALVYWFSYDNGGRQAWFFGVGAQTDSGIRVDEMFLNRGGRFGPDFDPADVETTSWGDLDIRLGCDHGQLDYESGLTDYGAGRQTLLRLTRPGDPDCEPTPSPNILLVIADDLGLDASSLYDISAMQPLTPTLDELAQQGLVFENAWSNPTCSATRAGILTGKYGFRTGVLAPGDELSVDETSLQAFIHQHLPGRYADAVIGKWHLAGNGGDRRHPNDLGISHFAGITGGGVGDYESWPLVIDGTRSTETQYVTSKLVDLAIDWTQSQDRPWFLWLAFNAPHTPFHLPPEHLHDRDLPGTAEHIEANPQPYYFAAIEALDTELGRLLDAMDADTRENTLVIFIGDNGTPGQVAQDPFDRTNAKGAITRGGINVPMLFSGAGVTRNGQREDAPVNTLDLFSTIAAVAGVNVAQVNDSIAFNGLLDGTGPALRTVQYADQRTETREEWAIAHDAHKLVTTSAGTQQLYDLTTDPWETNDLLAADNVPAGVLNDLLDLTNSVRHGPLPNLPDQPFDYAGTPLPEHYLTNEFPDQSRFQDAAVAYDNTPDDNPVTNAGATLGRVLFYDKKLSANGSISCSSCHQQAHGFADPRQFSRGFEGGETRRHSMGLANARFYFTGRFFWDERAESLEAQALMPFQDPVEMGLTLEELEQIVREQPYYPALFEAAFGDVEVTSDRIARALAQFQRSIVSNSSRYDIARSEVDSPVDDFPAFTTQQNRGKALFFQPVPLGNGESANCAGCHVSEAFVGPVPNGPFGATAATNNGLDAESMDDLGVAETTGNANDEGKFKAPSLVNIAARPPYMHDGRFATLEEVINHYSTGIQDHPNLRPPLQGNDGEPVRFNFSREETEALMAFLETLTDEAMLVDERFSDPFE